MHRLFTPIYIGVKKRISLSQGLNSLFRVFSVFFQKATAMSIQFAMRINVICKILIEQSFFNQ
jgi:hypothetical protein